MSALTKKINKGCHMDYRNFAQTKGSSVEEEGVAPFSYTNENSNRIK